MKLAALFVGALGTGYLLATFIRYLLDCWVRRLSVATLYLQWANEQP